MDVLKYITEQALVLIPALIFLGQAIKTIEIVPHKYIPLILLPIGVLGAMAITGWNIDSAIQGVLVTAAAVYGNQVWKQLQKSE